MYSTLNRDIILWNQTKTPFDRAETPRLSSDWSIHPYVSKVPGYQRTLLIPSTNNLGSITERKHMHMHTCVPNGFLFIPSTSIVAAAKSDQDNEVPEHDASGFSLRREAHPEGLHSLFPRSSRVCRGREVQTGSLRDWVESFRKFLL